MRTQTASGGEAPTQQNCPRRPRPEPASGPRWRRVFAGEEQQLAVLRRWLASFLPDCAARDDATSVACELAGNAVLHTASGQPGGWFAVEVSWYPPVLRVAVRDCGALAGPRLIDDPAGEHGRGLVVVTGLSVRTGVCGDQRGRRVWADVRWPGFRPADQVLRQALPDDTVPDLRNGGSWQTAWAQPCCPRTPDAS